MLAASGEDRKSVAGFGYCFDEKHAILEVDGFPREGDRLPGECSGRAVQQGACDGKR